MITERIGSVAYKIQLPDHSKIHPVFHVSLLKLFQGDMTRIQGLPSYFIGNRPLLLPLSIENTRLVLKRGRATRQVQVRWLGGEEGYTTWEDFRPLCRLYSHLHLEDKVTFEEGRDDKFSPVQLSPSQIEEQAHELMRQEDKIQQQETEAPARGASNDTVLLAGTDQRAGDMEHQPPVTRVRRVPARYDDYVIAKGEGVGSKKGEKEERRGREELEQVSFGAGAARRYSGTIAMFSLFAGKKGIPWECLRIIRRCFG